MPQAEAQRLPPSSIAELGHLSSLFARQQLVASGVPVPPAFARLRQRKSDRVLLRFLARQRLHSAEQRTKDNAFFVALPKSPKKPSGMVHQSSLPRFKAAKSKAKSRSSGQRPLRALRAMMSVPAQNCSGKSAKRKPLSGSSASSRKRSSAS